MRSTAVIGTASTMPVMPHTEPHIITASKTATDTLGLNLNTSVNRQDTMSTWASSCVCLANTAAGAPIATVRHCVEQAYKFTCQDEAHRWAVVRAVAYMSIKVL